MHKTVRTQLGPYMDSMWVDYHWHSQQLFQISHSHLKCNSSTITITVTVAVVVVAVAVVVVVIIIIIVSCLSIHNRVSIKGSGCP